MTDKLGPYDLNTIIHGDCLDVMPDIPAGSVDMILADLPYGTTACHWDSIIPLEPLWAEYKRVIKPRGAIVLTAGQPFTSMLVMSNLEWFKYNWVWEKPLISGFLDANRRPLNNVEDVLVFSDGQTTYNPQFTQGQAHLNGTRKRENFPDVYNGFNATTTTTTTTTYYPRRIVRIKNQRVEGQHPTQKPVALFAYLIRTYTNPGDLVLDNVAGSGTTAIAAIDTGRNWLCIEKDAEYHRLASERIAERLRQPFLIDPHPNGNGKQPEQLELIA